MLFHSPLRTCMDGALGLTQAVIALGALGSQVPSSLRQYVLAPKDLNSGLHTSPRRRQNTAKRHRAAWNVAYLTRRTATHQRNSNGASYKCQWRQQATIGLQVSIVGKCEAGPEQLRSAPRNGNIKARWLVIPLTPLGARAPGHGVGCRRSALGHHGPGFRSPALGHEQCPCHRAGWNVAYLTRRAATIRGRKACQRIMHRA